jgi:hypothetical protein
MGGFVDGKAIREDKWMLTPQLAFYRLKSLVHRDVLALCRLALHFRKLYLMFKRILAIIR